MGISRYQIFMNIYSWLLNSLFCRYMRGYLTVTGVLSLYISQNSDMLFQCSTLVDQAHQELVGYMNYFFGREKYILPHCAVASACDFSQRLLSIPGIGHRDLNVPWDTQGLVQQWQCLMEVCPSHRCRVSSTSSCRETALSLTAEFPRGLAVLPSGILFEKTMV